ncbi:MAG: flagellar filament capping protein FliD [Sulfurimonas sp.]|uniref:flagellar filament capping protein FliD n=1 Tax=Sulfurimonas sp. TaxID=2022749 RepID=UPI00261EA709|nr:flagellar filament capping protein FliD [Sulfurimonas sp.]MDD5400657.1 flagellar filament capping protein FliD [Sulfurimonas sp.]
MAGTVSSLGIGSGVLTADVLDQLKNVDQGRTIKPIESKITLNTQKQEAYKLLSSLMSGLGTNSSTLKYDTVFDKKSVNVSGSAEVSVNSGANVESFSLETVTLAKKDITKLGAVADKTTSIASGAGVLKINSFNIAYTATTTLEDLAQAITDTAGDSVSASVLKTGDGAYNLVISSKETGSAQALTITDTDGSGGAGFLNAALFNAYNATTNPNGYQKIQTASDATFKYNGITTTRPTNNIDDLIYGLNITLKKEGDSSNVNIASDYSPVTDELKLFVSSYNTLMSNLKDMTASDKEKSTEGIFSKDSFIKSISRDLAKTVTAFGSDGNSLSNFGITTDENGKMSFDKTVLDSKLRDDPTAVRLFFSGGVDSKGVEKTGIFETIDDKMKNYTGADKLLSNYEKSLKTEATSLTKNKTSAQKSLDSRYATMTAKFAAYDSMISKLNSQFSSLKMLIDSQANSKN